MASGMFKAGAAMTLAIGATIKMAMSWQSAFAGVRKTVDELDPAFGGLEGQLRGMARTMATTHEDIAQVAENAGALGVKTKDIAGFTRTMIMLGETTNLTADAASTSLAQFMTIMGSAPELVGRLGAALVDLGNNGASTEAQIVEMAQRIAGAARAVGFSESEVMGFASAIASTGINVEAGGSAISRVLTKLDRIVSGSGSKLAALTDFAGKDFPDAFRKDAAGATQVLIEKLGKLQESGGSITQVLDDMGIKGIYESDVMRRLAGSGSLLAEQLDIANSAMQTGTALLVEYGKRAETAESKTKVAWNNIKDAAIDAGTGMLPIVEDAADGVSDLMRTFQGLPAPIKAVASNLAGVTAAALLLGGGGLKAVRWGTQMVSSFKALETSAPKAANGIRKASIAAGLLAAATVAFRAIGAATDEQAEVARTKGTDIATGLAEGYASGLEKYDFSTLLSDKFGDALGASSYSGADALRRIYGPNPWERIITTVNSTLAGSDAGARLRKQIGEIDQSFALLAQSGNREAAAAGFRDFEQFVTDSGIAMADVLPDMDEYRQALDQVAEGLGLGGQITEGEFVDWMRGKVPDAVQRAIAAGDAHVDTLTKEQQALAGVAQGAEDATKALVDYAAMAMAVAGNRVGVEQSFTAGETKGTVGGDGTISGGVIRKGGFSAKTSTGQHNVQTVIGMASAANAYLQSLQDANADTEKISNETATWRDRLTEVFVAGGKTREEAEAIAATYIRLPDEAPTFEFPDLTVPTEQAKTLEEILKEWPELAETQILVPGARPSKREVDEFIESVDDIPPEKEAWIRTIAELGGVEAAQDALAAIRSKTVYVNIVERNKSGQYTGKGYGKPGGAADGAIFTTRRGAGLVRAMADGGLPPIGNQRPRIEYNRGPDGILWSETGAGPWEGFVSGHPGKRARSRAVTDEIADRLGGDVVWRNADGAVGSYGSPVANYGTPVEALGGGTVVLKVAIDARGALNENAVWERVAEGLNGVKIGNGGRPLAFERG
ncbi:MAG: phage tail tape measure protein [Propionicimonas sp.]|nr:phage tail tape measure protein [Propionicimonas sp.]